MGHVRPRRSKKKSRHPGGKNDKEQLDVNLVRVKPHKTLQIPTAEGKKRN